jgi:hypothetical protein
MSQAMTTYLNDHLAGSVAAIELMDHLLAVLTNDERRAALAGVRRDIAEDQELLQEILHELGGSESGIRKAAAWVAEKIGRAKLRLDDAGSGELRLLEALETVALGIQGKLALWASLATQREDWPELKRLDFDRLRARAEDQHGRVESLRLRSARVALVRSA